MIVFTITIDPIPHGIYYISFFRVFSTGTMDFCLIQSVQNQDTVTVHAQKFPKTSKICDTVAVTGDQCLHLIYPLPYYLPITHI